MLSQMGFSIDSYHDISCKILKLLIMHTLVRVLNQRISTYVKLFSTPVFKIFEKEKT